MSKAVAAWWPNASIDCFRFLVSSAPILSMCTVKQHSHAYTWQLSDSSSWMLPRTACHARGVLSSRPTLNWSSLQSITALRWWSVDMARRRCNAAAAAAAATGHASVVTNEATLQRSRDLLRSLRATSDRRETGQRSSDVTFDITVIAVWYRRHVHHDMTSPSSATELLLQTSCTYEALKAVFPFINNDFPWLSMTKNYANP